MKRPTELPIEARRAAWDALWRRLLTPPPTTDEKERAVERATADDPEADMTPAEEVIG
jgi:hypothetical protein